MRLPLAFGIFATSSFYVILLNYLAFSSRSLQKGLVVIIVVLLVLLYRSSSGSWSGLTRGDGKYFFVFWGTVLVQLIVLSTGGLQSPFLVLLHLSMISLSFVFSFSVSLLFLVTCLIVIAVDISLSKTIIDLVIENPNTLLTIVSFIPIVPISYIISRQYHTKDVLFGFLREKAAADEVIFSSLSEMIVVTDTKFRILSVNDSAVRTLQQSRSELLNKPLFDALLLRDEHEKLVTAQTFFPSGEVRNPSNTEGSFTLIKAPTPERNVTLQIQPVKNAGEEVNQISFIIKFTQTAQNTLAVTLDQARARYDALSQNIKQKLLAQNLKDIHVDVLLLEKIEQDTYALQTLKNLDKKKSRIDVAQLCKQTVLQNQDFASSLQVETQFALLNFGEEDIKPLTVANFPVRPDQLTGPFFTVLCEVKQLELVIKKLFDIGIFLASTTRNGNTPKVTLNAQRGTNDDVVVKVTSHCPELTTEELKSIYTPYYDRLAEKTGLRIGSGLEGFLVKQITESLHIPVETNYEQNSHTVTFVVKIPKNIQ